MKNADFLWGIPRNAIEKDRVAGFLISLLTRVVTAFS